MRDENVRGRPKTSCEVPCLLSFLHSPARDRAGRIGVQRQCLSPKEGRNMRRFASVAMTAAILMSAAGARAADDVVVADFEGKDYGTWKVEGEAFGPGP